jgi:hypothetical protein
MTVSGNPHGHPDDCDDHQAGEMKPLKELALQTPGPVVAVTKVLYEDLKFVLPSNSGSYLKDRFRTAILGEGAA